MYMIGVRKEIPVSVRALTRPETHEVNRSQLRQKQRATLNLARGNSVVVISANDYEDEKLLLDKKYFDELVQELRSVMETLEIATDQKLFSQIMRAAKSLEKDARRGKLHSFEEAFGED
jgi:PHD/YefM family antitoxin component YafN of YafNO toxin-antitoxin module